MQYEVGSQQLIKESFCVGTNQFFSFKSKDGSIPEQPIRQGSQKKGRTQRKSGKPDIRNYPTFNKKKSEGNKTQISPIKKRQINLYADASLSIPNPNISTINVTSSRSMNQQVYKSPDLDSMRASELLDEMEIVNDYKLKKVQPVGALQITPIRNTVEFQVLLPKEHKIK